MNLYETMFSPTCQLNEQIARQIFEILPEAGPIMLIADRQGNCWPSDSEAFAGLKVNESVLTEIWSKIDDGAEPVITQLHDCVIAAAELATENTRCGYVALFLPRQQSGSALANTDLLETVVNQVNLIARLIEKNARLYELQLRQQPGTTDYVYSEVAAN